MSAHSFATTNREWLSLLALLLSPCKIRTTTTNSKDRDREKDLLLYTWAYSLVQSSTLQVNDMHFRPSVTPSSLPITSANLDTNANINIVITNTHNGVMVRVAPSIYCL